MALRNVASVNVSGYSTLREMRRAKPYHQGNLREALLEGAIRLIAEVGPTAFTLREVARRACRTMHRTGIFETNMI